MKILTVPSLVCIFVFLLASSAFAKTSSYISYMCSSENNLEYNICSGYIDGVIDNYKNNDELCNPIDLTFTEIGKMFVNYVNDSPELKSKGASSTVIKMLKEKFPCEIAKSTFPYTVKHIETGDLTVEYHYIFPVKRYEQDQQYEYINKSAAKKDSPEAAFIAYVPSMASQDIEWFLSSWDESSRNDLAENFKDQELKKRYLEGWKEKFAGSRLQLTRRLDRPEFVIIEAEVLSSINESPLWVDLIEINGEWFLTNKFSSDPIGSFYMMGKKRVYVPIDDLKNLPPRN